MKRAALTVLLGLPLAVIICFGAFMFEADRPNPVEPPPILAALVHPFVMMPLVLCAVWWLTGRVFPDER